MNKKNILRLLFGSLKEIGDQDIEESNEKCKYRENEIHKIIIALEDAKKEWDAAGACFEFANDSRLIDYAIYKEAAAKARYMYLLGEAKKMGIRMGVEKSLERVIEA